MTIWPSAAVEPAEQVEDEEAAVAEASSTLSPKIHRYHMLPMTCDQPPCRNIDVTSVTRREVARHDPVHVLRNRSSSRWIIDSSSDPRQRR